MNQLLQQLSETVGVSGDEKAVRLLIRDLIQEHVDEWHIDPMGNLIALKKGTGASNLKIMLDAHMDEVGLMLTEAHSDGTFGFECVGGFDDRALLGKIVQVGEKKIPGVIGARPVHLLTGGEYTRVVKRDTMRIDIGATSKESALKHGAPGDRVGFLTPYEEWDQVALGKALDDRVGCALIIELLRGERYPFDLYAAFTVQEEVGLRGATTAAYHIQPSAAFILDCTPAFDLPHPANGDKDSSPNVALGLGPAVYVMDSGTIQDPRMVSYLLRTAEENNLPIQIRRPGGGGTNTASVQKAAGGTAVATISLPGRYLHAPISMIRLDDYQHTLALLQAALRNFTPDIISR
jgi:tetrahedral aminopeptidase